MGHHNCRKQLIINSYSKKSLNKKKIKMGHLPRSLSFPTPFPCRKNTCKTSAAKRAPLLFLIGDMDA